MSDLSVVSLGPDRIEPLSLTWRSLMEWADAEIAKLQIALEEPGKGTCWDDVTRGRIAQLRDLKKLAGGPPKPRMVAPPRYDAT